MYRLTGALIGKLEKLRAVNLQEPIPSNKQKKQSSTWLALANVSLFIYSTVAWYPLHKQCLPLQSNKSCACFFEVACTNSLKLHIHDTFSKRKKASRKPRSTEYFGSRIGRTFGTNRTSRSTVPPVGSATGHPKRKEPRDQAVGPKPSETGLIRLRG